MLHEYSEGIFSIHRTRLWPGNNKVDKHAFSDAAKIAT